MGWLFPDLRVWIRGAGDLASGVAIRLHRSGVPVVLAERPTPLFVRRAVAFGEALYRDGQHTVEGVHARQANSPEGIDKILARGEIPVLIDPDGALMRAYAPPVIVDARMQKQPLDTHRSAAPLVIALGPGYEAGRHCHAVIETNRGHQLGRVIWQGTAQADTGTPGIVQGYSAERVLRASRAGHVQPAPGIEIG
ncbi:MAG: selenium-dependent molybdenum cofactor biosynthesis protein YqeB, partial [Anaerolineales bacterium]